MTENRTTPDKSPDEIALQRFQMVEDLTKELAGEVVFPVCFDIALRIRKLMDDPNASIDKIALVLRADPLISTKLVALANSVAYGGDGKLRDIKAAITRMGLKVARTTSLAIAMRQMLLAKGTSAFADLAQKLWKHSLLAASSCSVIARRMTRIDPDEAYFAGLIHDLGAFYMIYRAATYPELVERPDTLKHLVIQWHESIGLTLLTALAVPENVVGAIADHDTLREVPASPRNLQDVVYTGNILAGSHFEWLYQDVDLDIARKFTPPQQYLDLSEEIRAHVKSMAAVFESS